MKTIEVVAAIIYDNDKIFVTQRGYGEFKGGWEFPGGKIENGETKEEALVREIHEELEATVNVNKLLHTVEYDYPQFHLTMYCYMCTIKSGELILKEHSAAKWLSINEIDSVDFLAADLEIVPILKKYIK